MPITYRYPRWFADVYWLPERAEHQLFLHCHLPDGKRSYVSGLIMKEIEAHAVPIQPVELNPDHASKEYLTEAFLQAVIDATWEAGMRPKQYNPEEMTAQGVHLKDMRRIAFRKLGIELENP